MDLLAADNVGEAAHRQHQRADDQSLDDDHPADRTQRHTEVVGNGRKRDINHGHRHDHREEREPDRGERLPLVVVVVVDHLDVRHGSDSPQKHADSSIDAVDR